MKRCLVIGLTVFSLVGCGKEEVTKEKPKPKVEQTMVEPTEIEETTKVEPLSQEELVYIDSMEKAATQYEEDYKSINRFINQLDANPAFMNRSNYKEAIQKKYTEVYFASQLYQRMYEAGSVPERLVPVNDAMQSCYELLSQSIEQLTVSLSESRRLLEQSVTKIDDASSAVEQLTNEIKGN